MATLQEYLDLHYPTKEHKEKVTVIKTGLFNEGISKGYAKLLEGGELDLSEYVNLEIIAIVYKSISENEDVLKTPLTKLTLGNNPKLNYINLAGHHITSLNNFSKLENLEQLICDTNQLTSIDFLNQLPNPKKLEKLILSWNNIQPTTLDFLRPFVNINNLMLGGHEKTDKGITRNRFYGSLEPMRNLTKLSSVCLENTDVDSGLEYIPTNDKIYYVVNCYASVFDEQQKLVKTSRIQDELRPFNYDVKAWQLANPEKMINVQPEYFINSDSQEKWLGALSSKILQTQQEIIATEEGEGNKVKKIERLKSKLQKLIWTKEAFEKSTQTDLSVTTDKETQTEMSTTDKFTQTDLTSKEIKDLKIENFGLKTKLEGASKENQQLKEEIRKLKEQLNNQLTTQIEVKNDKKLHFLPFGRKS